jgi:hypothetical protein
MNRATTGNAPSGHPLSFGKRVGVVLLAAVSSFFFVGLGQVYTRKWWRALGYSVACFVLWFVLLGWLVHFASIVDAVITSTLETGEASASEDSRWGMTWTSVFVAINAVLTGLGAYLAYQYFDQFVAASGL